jgi:hypothetical protein
MSEGNLSIIKAWDTVLFERFSRFRHLLVEGLLQQPGGSLTQVVWRKREENPWLPVAQLCVEKIVPAQAGVRAVQAT